MIERGERLADGADRADRLPQARAGDPRAADGRRDVTGAARAVRKPDRARGEPTKSVLFVPLVTGGGRRGVISLQNVDRAHAFTESDRQLLMTLAGSLSVALENARLVHETRQRNAELALINSVQDAIAGELDPQAIYDVVGDKLQEVFDAQVVSISIYDDATDLLEFPYMLERGERLERAGDPADRLPQARDRVTRAAAARVDWSGGTRALRQPVGHRRKSEQVGDLRPAARRRTRDGRDLAPERRPLACVRRGRRAAPDDAGRKPQRRARQRAPRPRDAAARRRVGNREQRRPGAFVAARPRSTDRARRRAGAWDVRRRHRVRGPARRGGGADRVHLLLRDGRAPPGAIHRVRRGADISDPPLARAAAAQPEGAVRGTSHNRNALSLVSRRADPRRRPVDRRNQHPERRGGRPVRRGRLAPPRHASPPTSASRSRTRACSPR